MLNYARGMGSVAGSGQIIGVLRAERDLNPRPFGLVRRSRTYEPGAGQNEPRASERTVYIHVYDLLVLATSTYYGRVVHRLSIVLGTVPRYALVPGTLHQQCAQVTCLPLLRFLFVCLALAW